MTVRDTVALSFRTDDDRLRVLKVPDPQPGIEWDSFSVLFAAIMLIESDVFERPGSLRGFDGAYLDRVSTRELF